MQELQAVVTIEIPADKVLISRDEWERMNEANDIGRWWSMSELEAYTNRKSAWLVTHILDNHRYKKVLNVENGGFVKYPSGGKSGYLMLASKMKEFLENNFKEIVK